MGGGITEKLPLLGQGGFGIMYRRLHKVVRLRYFFYGTGNSMKKIRQISIFIENKPGHLRNACRLLADAGIDVESMALADTEQFGILRFIVKDWEKAKHVFENEGLVVRESEMVAVSVDDRPGGLADVLDVLDQTQLNIEYMYGHASRNLRKAILFFRFNNIDEAIELLQANHIPVLTDEDLFQR